LAETKVRENYNKHYQIYTDASKQIDGRIGIGITDVGNVESNDRLNDLFQIINGELVAMLAIFFAEETLYKEIVIFTDSLSGCQKVERGYSNNYLVHLIREQVQRINDKMFTLQ